VLLLDPARGLREAALEDFERSWGKAGHLALVVLPPPSDEAVTVGPGGGR
jgi:hypothetical protein